MSLSPTERARSQEAACRRKKRYTSRVNALLGSLRISRRDERLQGGTQARTPRSAYCCPICRGWHLSAQTPRGRA